MKLFAEVDVDKNGTLDFEEFHVLVRKLRQRPELQGAHIKLNP
jgi:Ca2+-binding EF-hand superfamily protein